MVRGLQSLGKTVFLTTHYMDEAQELAGRIAVIRRGEIVFVGPPQELIERDPNSLIRFRFPEGSSELIADIEGLRVVKDGFVEVETIRPTQVLYELTSRANRYGRELEDLSVTRASLEDMYLRLVEEGGT